VATAEERLATRASSTCSLTIGRAKSKLNDAPGLHTNTIVLTDHSLARGDFVATAEERLATRASSTCSLTIGRAKSKLNDAPGLHTVAMPTDHICRATVCKDGALIAHRKISADVTPIMPLHTTLTATSQTSLRVRSACRCALRSLAAI
jgi:hypothetical protein